ncbi:molybdenum cofactor biosynthesis enzyme MoaA [Bradyrhizobium sp. JR1.5]|uniref:4Fe-4S cluster-binding domain-containing protein n=1 Tax=unclassified Bradyrhizobium TaxID=2631580 RepID=UPI003395D366
MPVDKRLSIVLDQLRICVSFYCNLHCKHCYVPQEYRDEYKRRLEPSQLSVEMPDCIDLLVDQYGLTKVSVTGGEPLLRTVFSRTEAVLAHGKKAGDASPIE